MKIRDIVFQQLHIPNEMKNTVENIIDEVNKEYDVYKIIKKYKYVSKQIRTLDNNYKIVDEEVNKALHNSDDVIIGLISLGDKSQKYLQKNKDDIFSSYIINEIFNIILFELMKKSWCELINKYKDLGLTPLIVPGEKQYSLSTQELIFSVLKPQDINLNRDSYFITPVKTITFIIGIGKNIKTPDINQRCIDCGYCFVNIKINDKKYKVKANTKLLDILIELGFKINNYCGGNQICGKCIVYVKDKNEFIETLACKTLCVEGLEVWLNDLKGTMNITSNYIKSIKSIDVVDKETGIVFDIGTTTIIGALYGLQSKQKLDSISEHNMQHIYGADVISRINYSILNEQGLDVLHKTIIKQMSNIISRLHIKGKPLKKIVVVGNPTMISIINKLSLESLAVYPYKNEVERYLNVNAQELKLKFNVPITFIYAASSFIGSDIVSGIIACGFLSSNKISLLIDLGTNGEIALGNNKQIIACSTAAGPAFEGASIECGVPSISGAIYEVSFGERVNYKTIDNQEPIGFCGSGLIDVVAKLLDQKIINEKGLYLKEQFAINKKIYISQHDIRELQLAKSAIITGIEILINKMNIKYTDINHVYLSGGFGSNINIDSAIDIGLIPKELKSKIKLVGNSALHGGVLYLLESSYQDSFDKLKPLITTVDLVSDSTFTDKFFYNLVFKKNKW